MWVAEIILRSGDIFRYTRPTRAAAKAMTLGWYGAGDAIKEINIYYKESSDVV